MLDNIVRPCLWELLEGLRFHCSPQLQPWNVCRYSAGTSIGQDSHRPRPLPGSYNDFCSGNGIQVLNMCHSNKNNFMTSGSPRILQWCLCPLFQPTV